MEALANDCLACGLHKDGTIFYPVICLSFVRDLILVLFGLVFGCEVFFVVEALLLVVKLWGSQKVSPSFPHGTNYQNQYY
jgi:hypothetical protein